MKSALNSLVTRYNSDIYNLSNKNTNLQICYLVKKKQYEIWEHNRLTRNAPRMGKQN